MDDTQIGFRMEELRLRYIMQLLTFVFILSSFVMSLAYNFNINMTEHIDNDMQYPIIVIYILLAILFLYMHVITTK